MCDLEALIEAWRMMDFMTRYFGGCILKEDRVNYLTQCVARGLLNNHFTAIFVLYLKIHFLGLQDGIT